MNVSVSLSSDSLPTIYINTTSDVAEGENVLMTCRYFAYGSLSPAPVLQPNLYWTDFYGQNVSSSSYYTSDSMVYSEITVIAGRQDMLSYVVHFYVQLMPASTNGYASNTPTVNISASSPVIEVLCKLIFVMFKEVKRMSNQSPYDWSLVMY